MIIQVKKLRKEFKVPKKKPGLMAALTSVVRREYSVKQAVDDVSFTIAKGELVGFIGPNGAGKTTTLKCLSGLLYPTSGTVSVLNTSPWERKPSFLSRIAMVMGQKNQLWWDLPAEDSFLLNKELYRVSDAQYSTTVKELIELLDVGAVLHTPVRNLSLGQRMKCELIAALIHRPSVLFLDEPTIGLDVMMQKNLRDFIRAYNERHEATILLTSHYMEDVKELCKRIIMIDSGRIMYDGLLADISRKFATYKRLVLIFSRDVSRATLQQYGTVKEYESRRAIITVPLASSNAIAATILDKLPVIDVNIEEPKIEDIIRAAFNTSHS